MNTDNSERTLQLGRLGRTIGLDGGLLFHAAGPAEADLLEPGLTVMAEGHGEQRIRDWRRHNRGIVVFFEGIRRVETARALTNAVLSVSSSSLPADVGVSDLRDGLIGLKVLLDGTEIGTVRDVAGLTGFEYVTLEPGGQLIPLNAPYVTVSSTQLELTDPPEGLV